MPFHTCKRNSRPPMSEQNQTPETDAAVKSGHFDSPASAKDFTQNMEKERNVALAERDAALSACEAQRATIEELSTKLASQNRLYQMAVDNQARFAEDDSKLRAEVARLTAVLAAAKADKERLDWLEAEAAISPTGISFDHCRHVEDGYVVEKGFRFMRKHFLGDRKKTLRDAIDSAQVALTIPAALATPTPPEPKG